MLHLTSRRPVRAIYATECSDALRALHHQRCSPAMTIREYGPAATAPRRRPGHGHGCSAPRASLHQCVFPDRGDTSAMAPAPVPTAVRETVTADPVQATDF